MVTSELHDGQIGGAGTYVYRLSRELTREGHRVDIIANMTARRAQTPFGVYELKLSRFPIFGALRWSIAASVYSMKLMRSRDYDVVHVHHPSSMMYPLISSPRIPMIATIHRGWALTNPRKSPLGRMVDFLTDLAVCRKCRRVIVLNRDSEFQFLRWGISRDKIQYIPNGIDCSEFLGETSNSKALRERLGVPRGDVAVLYVGRLERGKGVANLLEALQILQRHARKPVWVIVVGDGSLRRSLMRRSRDLRNVVFTGLISRDDLLAAYTESDLFVIPSEGGEGMPTALLEAMAAGLPVIATRIPGNTELVETEFGRLFAPGDAQQLALALLDMIGDRASLRRMRSSASSFSRRYDWNIIAARIAKVFESCL